MIDQDYINYLEGKLPKHLKVHIVSQHFVQLITEQTLTADDLDYLVNIGLGFINLNWEPIPHNKRYDPRARQVGHVLCRREK